MKASLAAARQAQAAESVAENTSKMQEQLDRIEVMLSTLLESLAHDNDAGDEPKPETPKRGRPARSE